MGREWMVQEVQDDDEKGKKYKNGERKMMELALKDWQVIAGPQLQGKMMKLWPILGAIIQYCNLHIAL